MVLANVSKNPFLRYCIISITILANCKTLDPTWKEVVTEPVLPVQHGTEITLSCPADYTNKGSDKAVCQDGVFDPTGGTPICHRE